MVENALENGAPLLDLRNISKSFGSVQVLTDVDFEVGRGEVMALVGDNGAHRINNAFSSNVLVSPRPLRSRLDHCKFDALRTI